MKIYKISQKEDFFVQLVSMMQQKGYIVISPFDNKEKCVQYADNSSFFTFSTNDYNVRLGVESGGLYFSRYGDSFTNSDAEKSLIIAGVVTEPKFRGKGLASKIMKDFMDCAKSLNIKVYLEPKPMKNYIEKDKASLSEKHLLEWYKGMGFKRLDPNNYPKSDRILTTHPMEVKREKDDLFV